MAKSPAVVTVSSDVGLGSGWSVGVSEGQTGLIAAVAVKTNRPVCPTNHFCLPCTTNTCLCFRQRQPRLSRAPLRTLLICHQSLAIARLNSNLHYARDMASIAAKENITGCPMGRVVYPLHVPAYHGLYHGRYRPAPAFTDTHTHTHTHTEI